MNQAYLGHVSANEIPARIVPHAHVKHHTPLRVVHVVDDLSDLGTFRMVCELVTRLDPAEYACSVVVVGSEERMHSTPPIQRFVSRIQAAGISVVIIEGNAVDRSSWKALSRYLKSIECDVLHTHSFQSDVEAELTALRSNVPISVSTEHELYHYYSWVKRTMRCLSHWKRTAIVAVSQHVKTDILFHCRRTTGNKVTVIYNGVDVDHFYHPVVERQPVAEPVIAITEKLEPEKGHQELLQALTLVKHPYQLYIYGEGSLKSRLVRTVKKLGLEDRVTFKGVSDQMAEVYKTVDIVCIPTLWPGFELGLFEAMSAGCAVVASNIDAHREILKDDSMGVTIDPKQPYEFAAIIERLLVNPQMRLRMGLQAQEYAKTHLSIEKMVAEYDAFYHSLL